MKQSHQGLRTDITMGAQGEDYSLEYHVNDQEPFYDGPDEYSN